MQRYSLIHPRCGTAFLLWVMVIAIFVFAFFGQPAWYWLIATRILLLPVIAGIAYELIRFAGKHTDNRVADDAARAGSLAAAADDARAELDQLEVSIRALQEVLRREGGLTAGGAPSRGHGLAGVRGHAADQRDAEVTWEGSSRERPRRHDAGTSGAFAGLPFSEPMRIVADGTDGDEPRGAPRGCARRLLRDAARGRADPRPHAAGAARRPLDVVMDEVEGVGHRIVASRSACARRARSDDGAFARCGRGGPTRAARSRR